MSSHFTVPLARRRRGRSTPKRSTAIAPGPAEADLRSSPSFAKARVTLRRRCRSGRAPRAVASQRRRPCRRPTSASRRSSCRAAPSPPPGGEIDQPDRRRLAAAITLPGTLPLAVRHVGEALAVGRGRSHPDRGERQPLRPAAGGGTEKRWASSCRWRGGEEEEVHPVGRPGKELSRPGCQVSRRGSPPAVGTV